MKKIFLLALMATVAFTSCKKDNFEQFNPNTGGFELKQVTASFAGIIVGADEQALEGVYVSVGTNNTTTDEHGAFFFENISVPNTKTYFTATKTGYFLGSRTLFAQEGSTHQVRIKMLDNSPIGSVQNNTGGVITLAEGGQLTFEAGDVAYPNGDAFTGQVNVAAKRIDPTTDNGQFEMPGDLRAQDANDNDMTLVSYGMMAVELTDNSGNLLQVAEGQSVDIKFEVPSSLVATAPAQIPLWYFDEANGLWKEEGSATLSGNTYEGQVSHFSYWNCDANFPRVYFEATFLNENGEPLVNAWVSIELPGGNRRAAMTNDAGWVGGEVMANATMKIYITANQACYFLPQYLMDFTTTNLDVNLGNITVTLTAPITYNLSGTVVDCASQPVSNGYVSVHSSVWYLMYNEPVNSDGTFNVEYTTCEAIDSVYLTVYDYGNLEQSDLIGYDLSMGSDLGNVMACGIVLDEYITFNYTTVSGNDTMHTMIKPYIYFSDADSTGGDGWNISGYQQAPSVSSQNFYLSASTKSTGTYSGLGYLEGGTGFQEFFCDFNVTSYPNVVGEYIEGTFVSNNATPVVTGSFKLKK